MYLCTFPIFRNGYRNITHGRSNYWPVFDVRRGSLVLQMKSTIYILYLLQCIENSFVFYGSWGKFWLVISLTWKFFCTYFGFNTQKLVSPALHCNGCRCTRVATNTTLSLLPLWSLWGSSTFHLTIYETATRTWPFTPSLCLSPRWALRRCAPLNRINTPQRCPR